MPPHDFRLLRVTAELSTPARLSLYWPAPLDGVLAPTAAPTARAGAPAGRPVRDPTPDLPLAASRHLTGRKQWHWWASCAEPVNPSPEWDSRFDTEHSPASLITLDGPLQWWAVGDRTAVSQLLEGVRRLSPHPRDSGQVTQWRVTDEGERDFDTVLWTDDDRIARPVAARHAHLLGLPDSATVPGAVRPPYHRQPQTGDGRYGWRPVIAPWLRC